MTTGIFTLALTSRANQAIGEAGPILGDKEARTLTTAIDEDGLLASTPGSDIPLKAARVAPDKLATTKARLTARL
ncbi:MAG: hypothetical protein QM760_02910 [Nibricoccus sp.]